MYHQLDSPLSVCQYYKEAEKRFTPIPAISLPFHSPCQCECVIGRSMRGRTYLVGVN